MRGAAKSSCRPFRVYATGTFLRLSARYHAVMQRVPPPDSHHLNAALGWMELGAHADAVGELKFIRPKYEQHPDVLEVRWAVHAAARDLNAAVEAARLLVQRAPGRSTGWLHQAYALRRATDGGVEQALRALLPAVDKFPTEPVIPFNLSCYACQMNRLDEARLWLDRAFKVGKQSELKSMALTDEDLKALWPEIQKL